MLEEKPTSPLDVLERVCTPVWVFDIDRRRMHWANAAAVRLWGAVSQQELCARDHGADMSESVARRLAQYQADFCSQQVVFREQWTLYPGGQPMSLDVSFSGYRLTDGRMAMLCEAHDRVQASPQSLRSVEALLHTPVMITMYDRGGHALYRNPAARAMVAAPSESLRQHLADGRDWARLHKLLGAQGQATITLQVHTVCGVRWHEVSARRCRDAVSGEAATLLSEVDVSALKESEARASYLAGHDTLTGLPNRSQVRARFAQAMAKLAAGATGAALVLIDLDHFKNVNDTLGHAVGDELLVEVAQRLRQATRRQDLVARFGGDEFLLLLAGQDIEAEVGRIDERIRQLVAEPIPVAGTSVRVTATLGAALFPRDGRDFETLLRRADLAMYAAKEGGRNALAYYEDAMGQRLRARTELEQDLRRALAERALEVYYQPRVQVASGRIVGAEALVRWRHPRRGMVPPDEFIPLCESAGLIRQLGQQVFDTAARQVARWKAAGYSLVVSVNVSPREFAHEQLVAELRAALDSAACEPALVQVEITESSLLGQDERALRTLHELCALGLTVALDDFGTGYSNLGFLRSYPIHALKIDRSFVHGLHENRALADLIVELCRLMKLSAVAEGVETEEQLRWVRERGIEQYQGFLCSPALPATEFEALLRRQDAPAGVVAEPMSAAPAMKR